MGLSTLVLLGRAWISATSSGVEHARALGMATAAAYWVSSVTLAFALFVSERRLERDDEHRDIAPLARAQLRSIQAQARPLATSAPSTVARAHWADIADRVAAVLEPPRR